MSMLITKTSTLTGITRTVDLPITEEQFTKYCLGHDLIQNTFPDLSASQREFLISGTTDEEWDQYMKENESN